MHDLELRKVGDVHLSENNLYNFGVEEYCAKFDVQRNIASDKKIAGVVLDYDDDTDSIHRFIDLAIAAGVSILIFDTRDAKGLQMMYLRRYMNEKYPRFQEISSIYEIRVVYATENNSFRHI